MLRLFSAIVAASSVFLAFSSAAGPTDDELRKKPITADGGEIGRLLKNWGADGTVAGNVGDWYDNRDGEHSPLDLRPWPQLRKVHYTEDDVKRGRHWALQPRTLPHVVFGNSSTSAQPEMSGSNPRTYYCAPDGLPILARHYRHNNIYIYPEHRDHDPGHNGVGDGYGDLYPTNTPYLLISQGSSGSDQPFMRAIPFTLAAFRPEVKKKLVESGLLMPALQMILRSTNKHLKNPKEYPTGKAHPTVFEGSWVDPLRMMKLAHEIRSYDIPPLVKLEVTQETKTVAGQDFFEPPGYSEQHADTISVISRFWRGKEYSRRLVVSARDSLDVNKNPLTFKWVILRGDKKRIRIKPLNKTNSVAEISVDYHERRPISPGSAMESNRVDIGVFAHNGTWYSAPGFITFYSLDNEGRTYDKGRPIEIGYGMGETEWKVPNEGNLLSALAADSLPARIFQLSADQRADLRKCAEEYRRLQQAMIAAREVQHKRDLARHKAAEQTRMAEKILADLRKLKKDKDEIQKAEKILKSAQADQKQAETSLQAAQKKATQAETAANRFLDARRPGLKSSPRAYALRVVREAAQTPALWNTWKAAFVEQYNKPANASRRGRIDEARRKLLHLGIITDGPDKTLILQPARVGTGPASERLTTYEKAMLEQFHAVVLANLVLPDAINIVFHTNFVDQRLTTPKLWRDVYHHDDAGKLLGWTRYRDGKVSEFTEEGLLVVKKDAKGRPIEARTVVYKQNPPTGRVWVNGNPLNQVDGGEVVTFEYDGNKRKEKSREKVLER